MSRYTNLHSFHQTLALYKLSLEVTCVSSLVAQTVKYLPAVQKSWVEKIPWEKAMATHSSVLACKVP